MQHVSCTVALSGDITNTVHKADITVAEVAVLRAIHGAGAIMDIRALSMDKRPHAEEIARLRGIYQAKDGDGRLLINLLFPGITPTLPVRLSDIGLEETDEPPVRPAKAPAETADAITSATDGAGE